MPVVLKLEGLEFQIPKKFYTMDGSVAQNYQKDCILLFKSNSFANKVGYILGAPFVQAFHIELDYAKNRVGFGNKVHAAGAHIYGFKPTKGEPTSADET